MDVIEIGRLVVRMLPKSTTLMAGTALYESIQQKLLLCAAAIAIVICGHCEG